MQSTLDPTGTYQKENNHEKPTTHSPSSLKGWQPQADKVNREAREGALGYGVDVLHINNHTIYKHYTPNLPRNHQLKEKAKRLRKAGILSEVLFWQQVHQKKFYGIDFDRQCIIGHYIVDFYIKSLSLVIEIDGSSHDAKGAYDEERHVFLQSLKLNIYRIENKEIKSNLSGVMQNLEDYIVLTYSTPHPSGTPLQEGNNDA